MAELNDTVQEELEDVSDSPAETPNVLVDESPLSAENLPTDIQTLRQKIMDHLPTEHGQRPYLPKLRCEITDEILYRWLFSCFISRVAVGCFSRQSISVISHLSLGR